jgi:Protein of unknown function (DUF2480)
MDGVLVNKVSESGLVTLDLEDYYPKEETAVFDMKDHLFMGMILKEKDFRETMKNLDLAPYKGMNVALNCSADAIIPMWAYMLAASYLEPVANEIVFGDADFLHKTLFLKNIAKINTADYNDKRVVIKGCGELPVSETAYVAITSLLRPVAKSIMYGEPCSTVPIYKRSKNAEA